MRVARWGISLAVRIPAGVVDALGLKAGDEVEIRVANRRDLEIASEQDRKDLIRSLRAFRGRLPTDFVFDRQEANKR